MSFYPFSLLDTSSFSKLYDLGCEVLSQSKFENDEFYSKSGEPLKNNRTIELNSERKFHQNNIHYLLSHSSPRRLAGEKKSDSYNHKTTIWVCH